MNFYETSFTLFGKKELLLWEQWPNSGVHAFIQGKTKLDWTEWEGDTDSGTEWSSASNNVLKPAGKALKTISFREKFWVVVQQPFSTKQLTH